MKSPFASAAVSLASVAALAIGCSADPDATIPTGTPTVITPVGPAIAGLHVVGAHLEDGVGATVVLRGVNRSGTEYQCAQGSGIFDGPADAESIQAMALWKINAVRIPLNEACWLGINGVASSFAGVNYKQAILDYVSLLHQFHIVPILDLHWVGPGTTPANRQQPMPDADHAPAFWTDVASTFVALGDDGVVFEPYNEPFPDTNQDSDKGWQCWRDGGAHCESPLLGTAMFNQACDPPAAGLCYETVGMQALVDSIRATGATNLILLGGLEYSNALSQWLTYAPHDMGGPGGQSNIAPAWHSYNFNACNSQAACWDTTLAPLGAHVPIVATEFGENDCANGYVGPLLGWLDGHGGSYLAWSWNAYGSCQPTPASGRGGQPWSLVTDYASGTPNGGYAQGYHDHLAGLGL